MLMNNWFECKVKTEKTLENGTQKKVTEPYLVDALNFTEAEARIIREISPYCNGELEVVDIKRVKYSEMFTNEAESADKWYKVKAMFITLDEKSQTEKKSATFILVQASDFQNAVDTFVNGMRGGMSDYEIHTIQETNILDVFPFEAVSHEKRSPADETPSEEEQFAVNEEPAE